MTPVAPVISSHATKEPIGNYAIMLAATCAFAVQMLLDPGARHLSGLVLERWSLPGLLGHMWLHMTMVHLVGNLVTLWIFGRYLCPVLGNTAYALTYVTVGLLAGMVHVVCDGRPVIGASGAIMGIFGMHVVICFRQFGRLGPWLVLTWFIATVGAGVAGGLPEAYFDHAGGFLCGMLLGLCVVLLRLVSLDGTDPALLSLLRHTPRDRSSPAVDGSAPPA